MKRIIYGFLLVLCASINANAQKRPLDTTDFNKWPEISRPMITGDGKYVAYTITASNADDTLNILSSSSTWKKYLIGHFRSIAFSSNSRILYFLNGNDSLGIYELGKLSIKYIPGIKSFQISNNEDQQYLAYLTKQNELVLTNASKHLTKTYHNVLSYQFSKTGNVLLIKAERQIDTSFPESLYWVDLNSWVFREIWEGLSSGQYAFDDSDRRLAFITLDSISAKGYHSIFLFDESMTQAVTLVSDNDKRMKSPFSIRNSSLLFSKSGTKLLFSLDSVAPPPPIPSMASSHVDIWNYKDTYLYSTQKQPYFNNWTKPLYWVVDNISTGQIVWLNSGNEEIVPTKSYENYILVTSKNIPTSYYKNQNRSNYYLCATADGARIKTIPQKMINPLPHVSPDENYVVWFDPDSLSYLSYQISTGATINLSLTVPSILYDSSTARNAQAASSSYDLAGWIIENQAVLIYDQFDIWKVDLKGQKKAQNLTNGYGRKKRIVFSLFLPNDTKIKNNSEFLLEGFSLANKSNGFWIHQEGSAQDPVKRIMDSHVYFIQRIGQTGHVDYPTGFSPIKAKHANIYLLKRMSVNEYPNLFITTDFSNYRQLSKLSPEKQWNWLSSELITWEMPNGEFSQGVLYKPENFDSTKKYPLIFNYYEKSSDELNDYSLPAFSSSNINVPYYVSNGYLVFLPDIYYSQAHNGQNVVDAMLSAARFLSRLSWVDSAKMGIEGHSFGGWETNFLITHTNIFAAACTAAGIANQTSIYDQDDNGNGDYEHFLHEVTLGGCPYGIGVTPWTRPDLYIENSPIFFLGNVTTPLLIEHGTADSGVPFAQAMEMFLGLRRAQKKVWLLEYEGANHGLWGEDARDFTTRMKQFFDYYLKNSAPPLWMTEGVPASKKGLLSDLDLDNPEAKP